MGKLGLGKTSDWRSIQVIGDRSDRYPSSPLRRAIPLAVPGRLSDDNDRIFGVDEPTGPIIVRFPVVFPGFAIDQVAEVKLAARW